MLLTLPWSPLNWRNSKTAVHLKSVKGVPEVPCQVGQVFRDGRALNQGWGNLACKIVKESALLGLSRIILLCLSDEESAEVNIKELPWYQACDCEITTHMLDYQVRLLFLKIFPKVRQ